MEDEAKANDVKKPFSSKANKKKTPAGKNKSGSWKKILIIVALLAFLAGAGFIIYKQFFMNKPAEAPVANTGYNNLTIDTTANNEREEASPLASRNVYFAGIDNSTCNSDTVIYLENLPDNEDLPHIKRLTILLFRFIENTVRLIPKKRSY